MSSTLLVVNAGSSSVKFSLYEHAEPRELRPGVPRRADDGDAYLLHDGGD